MNEELLVLDHRPSTCPHCGFCLDAPPGISHRWGNTYGHPFTTRMELAVVKKGDTDLSIDHYRCQECNGTWKAPADLDERAVKFEAAGKTLADSEVSPS